VQQNNFLFELLYRRLINDVYVNMNAIIGLCHFCEFCGPLVIFTTQTLRETKIEEIDFIAAKTKKCTACQSIGDRTGYLSKNGEGNSYFLSTQLPVMTDVANIVQQAAVRSLSCEVSANKDGGFVFFGDAIRGHTLSHTFNVRDSQARGFYKLYSIIILMKDKMFLLNMHPFLSKHLQVTLNKKKSELFRNRDC
jgi:folliculin